MSGWISSKLKVAETLLQQIDQQAAESLRKNEGSSRSDDDDIDNLTHPAAIPPKTKPHSDILKQKLKKKIKTPENTQFVDTNANDNNNNNEVVNYDVNPKSTTGSISTSLTDSDWTQLLSAPPTTSKNIKIKPNLNPGKRQLRSGSNLVALEKKPNQAAPAVVSKPLANTRSTDLVLGDSTQMTEKGAKNDVEMLVVAEKNKDIVIENRPEIEPTFEASHMNVKQGKKEEISGVPVSSSSKKAEDMETESDSDSDTTSDSETDKTEREERMKKREQLLAQKAAAKAIEAIKDRENLVARLEGEKQSLEKIIDERAKQQAHEASELQITMMETMDAVDLEKQKHNNTRMEALIKLAKLETTNAELAKSLSTTQWNLEAEVKRVAKLHRQIELKEASHEGMAVALKYVNRHNSVLRIDVQDQANAYYHPILNFLLRSRIHYLVTHNPVVVASYLREFWTSAQYDSTVNPAVIRATVNGLPLHFSLADLRRILQLGDADQDDERVEFPAALRAGAFVRMGYNGNAARPIIKSGLYGQWRFLAHVVIQCLSAKKGGFNELNAREQSLMIALVYNKPYSFSKFFFEAFHSLLEGSGRDKFLMFPRFVMMIILDRYPGIPIAGGTLSVASMKGRIFADCRSNKAGRPITELETPLFGHLVNENYVAPPNDGWDEVPVVQHEGEVPDIGVVGEAAAAPHQPQQQAQSQQAPPAVADEQGAPVEEIVEAPVEVPVDDRGTPPHGGYGPLSDLYSSESDDDAGNDGDDGDDSPPSEVERVVRRHRDDDDTDYVPHKAVEAENKYDYPHYTRTARHKKLKRTDEAGTSAAVDVAEAHGAEQMDTTPVFEAPVTEAETVEPVVEAVVPEVEIAEPVAANALGRPSRLGDYTARAARAADKGKSKAADDQGTSRKNAFESTSGAGRTVEEQLDILAHNVDYMYRLIVDGSEIVKNIDDRTRHLEATIARQQELTCGNAFLTRLAAQNRRLEQIVNLQQHKLTRADLRLDEADRRFRDLLRMNERLEQRVVRTESLLRDHLMLQAAQGETSCKGDVLRNLRKNDEGDDHSAPRERELSGSSKFSGMPFTSQGEPSHQGAGSGSKDAPVAVEDKKIDALKDIDEKRERGVFGYRASI